MTSTITAPHPDETVDPRPRMARRAGRARRGRRVRAGIAAAGLVVATLLAPLQTTSAAWADDDDLDQTLDADMPIVHGEHVLDSGHVDLGPKFDDDGTWQLMIHDDAARADANATSVWRYPEETAFHVVDEAELTVPDDDAYDFLGAEPGSTVWVVPQTQNPDVVWMGWNTQDPDVMETIDRGATLTLDGVEGPGQMTVYLQSGSFEAPQRLWTSADASAQSMWLDVNTHTHANWVFTEPGVYLVKVTVSADLVDGTSVSDTALLRFAVGTDTSTDEALAAEWQGEEGDEATAEPSETAAADDAQTDETDSGSGDILVPVLIGVIILVVLLLIVGFTAAIVRGNRAKKRVLAARAAARREADGAASGGGGAATAGDDASGGASGDASTPEESGEDRA